MGVDHGGFDILVPQQFLDGADVIAVFQQVGGETVPIMPSTELCRVVI